MPRYQICRRYAQMGSRQEIVQHATVEADNQEDADEAARAWALENVDYGAVEVDDDDAGPAADDDDEGMMGGPPRG